MENHVKSYFRRFKRSNRCFEANGRIYHTNGAAQSNHKPEEIKSYTRADYDKQLLADQKKTEEVQALQKAKEYDARKKAASEKAEKEAKEKAAKEAKEKAAKEAKEKAAKEAEK